jgi:hypothetical protein
MQPNPSSRLQELIDFVLNCPENDEIESMDCNDHCEKMACLAEQVAAGASLDDIRPALLHHMRYWRDCREEFIALVNILKMEEALPE